MPDNRLQLVVEVDTKKGNASIKGFNKNISGMEKQAISSAKKASKGIDGMSGSLSRLLKVAGGTAVLIGAYKAVKNLIFGSIKLQDEIGKTAQQVGLSSEVYSEYRHVAELAGISAEEFGAGVGVLAKNMFEATRGNNVYRQTFKQLKVDFKNSDGTLRNVNDVLEDMADRYKEMSLDTEKVAIARSIMGRSGSLMITALNQGSKAIREQRKEAHDLGIVIGDITAKRAAEFNDNLTRLKAGIQGVGFALAENLLPRLIELTDQMVQWVKNGGVDKMVQWLKEVAIWIKNIGLWIVGYSVVSNILKVAGAIRTATVAISAMNVALLANPWTLAAAGVGIFGYALYTEYKRMKEFTKGLEGLTKQADILAKLKQGSTIEDLKAAGYTDEQIKYTVSRGNQDSISPVGGIRFKKIKGLGYEWTDPGYIPKTSEITEEQQKQIDAALKHAKQFVQSIIKEREDISRFLYDMDWDYYQKKLEFENKLSDVQVENAQNLLAYKQDQAAITRDAALRELESINPQTIEQQKTIEARRADIEIAYIQQVHEVKRSLFNAETLQIIQQVELQKEVLAAAGQNTDQINRMIDEIKEQRKKLGEQIDQQTRAGIDAAKENAAIRQMQIVRDEQQRTFDHFKSQAEGVFDALVTKSQSVFSAMGNALKTAMLTAIKEVVTSHVARMMMQLFGGGRASFAQGSSTAGAIGGMASILGGGGGIGPGGTPPFVPSSTGGGSLFSNLNIMGSGWKNMLGLGGLNPASGIGPSMPFGSMSLGGQISSIATSPAAVMAGGMLALHGITRGNPFTGAVGGALLGAKLGSVIPGLGTAIGAGIGGVAGFLGGLFRETPEEKAKKEVKRAYGVNIQSKGVLTQIVGIAQQGFGGNIKMAVKSTQVQELVRLYAMTTGQNASGLRKQMTASTLVQSGGGLFQAPTYSNGVSLAASGGMIAPLPGSGLDNITAGTSSGGTIIIDVNIPGAKEFFEKETVRTVIKNPKAVQSAGMNALRSNYNRREMSALQLSPGTLTA